MGDLAVLTRSAEWKEMLRVCREHRCFTTRQAPPLPGVPAPLPAPQGEGEGQGEGHGEGQSQAAAAAEMVAQRYAAAQPHLAVRGAALFITFLEC